MGLTVWPNPAQPLRTRVHWNWLHGTGLPKVCPRVCPRDTLLLLLLRCWLLLSLPLSSYVCPRPLCMQYMHLPPKVHTYILSDDPNGKALSMSSTLPCPALPLPCQTGPQATCHSIRYCLLPATCLPGPVAFCLPTFLLFFFFFFFFFLGAKSILGPKR
jgi:hypothetical protein